MMLMANDVHAGVFLIPRGSLFKPNGGVGFFLLLIALLLPLLPLAMETAATISGRSFSGK